MGVRNTSAVRKETRGKKPRWVIDFRYLGKDGKWHRYRRDASVQTSAAARVEAERLYALATTTGSLETKSEAPLLREFVSTTFEALFIPRYRPSTRTRYRDLFKQGLLEELGGKRLDAIGPMEYRAFAAKLSARGVQLKGPLTLVRTVLRAGVEVGALAELPQLPKLFKHSKKLPDAPTSEEVEAMLKHADGWLRTAIALAALAGLRMGEVRALEVGDVDLASGCIQVRRSLSEDVVTTPKSGHERVVPLAPELLEILVIAMRAKLPKARVVVTSEGTTPRRTHVLSKLKALQSRHGLKERSFHSLRHYFCSTLLRRGASVEAVRVLAGHNSLNVTQRYVHATAADLKEAIAKLHGNG
jgi:integrase